MSDDKTGSIAVDYEDIDFDKIFRVGQKVNELIERKIKKPFEIYLLLKFLMVNCEHSLGIKLSPEDEEKIKQMLTEEYDDNNEVP